MTSVNYLSFTGWKTYNTCPEQYKNRYVLKIPEVDANQVNFVKGNALHHLLEAYLQNGGDDPNWMVEYAPLFWSKELTSIETNPRQTLIWNTGGAEKQRKIYLDWAYELAKLIKKHGLRTDRMQSEFKADSYVTFGTHRIKMGGRIDILLKNKQDDYVILDLKSSVNKDVVVTDQILWYAMLTDIFLGDQLDKPVAYGGFLLPGFPEGQKLQMFATTQEAKENLKLRITETLDNIAAGRFAPVEGKNCFFCPFKNICPLFGGAFGNKGGIVQLGG